MLCEKCKIYKPDVATRVFGGMSKLLCDDCQKKAAGQQGLFMLIGFVIVLVLLYIISKY